MSEIKVSPLVLIVDDAPSVRTLLKIMLEALGMKVIEAADGQDALEKLEAQKPDLVFLDIEMPKLDGIGFLRKRPDTLRHIPVIVVSTHNSVETIMLALQEGAREYIMKPFDEAMVYSKMHALGWNI